MKLTDKEKLDKAIEFIKKVENLEYKTIDVEDIITTNAECEECGSDEIDINIIGAHRVVEPEVIDALKEQAWHLLIDIA